ncbi:MAG: peroxidase family protein [Planctomycetota bacterium]
MQRGPVAPPISLRPTLADPPVFPVDFRNIDGTDNNLANPTWGAAGVPMIRTAPYGYSDGADAPAGADRASARAVSNAVAAAIAAKANDKDASDYLWQWGQFLDHDIVETPVGDEEFDIAVPLGDVFFDPFSTGTQVISLDRSTGVVVDGKREQQNNITAYIDGSVVYGSEHDRADWLRTFDGDGTLKVSEGNLLPFNTDGLHNAPSDHDPTFFLAGDIRASEQAALTAIHTLFVREHNRRAAQIRTQQPNLSGDDVYEQAKAITTAHIQAVTYNEFLTLLLGRGAIQPYGGYDDSINAGISNEFATAAYRVGHTMLSETLQRYGPGMLPHYAGHLDLADAFFDPDVTVEFGIEPLLRGLCRQNAQEIDNEVVDAVRNFLFGPPGAGGFDLASLNIQRGRDHGLASYNEIRAAFGRPPANTFAQVTSNASLQASFASVYDSPDDIDAWVGLLAEDHKPGAMVGETLRRVIRDEFVRLRDGDRFWYERYLPGHLVNEVRNTRLGDIINRNLEDGGDNLPRDVFHFQPCPADIAVTIGVLDLDDVDAFIGAFIAQDTLADFAAPFGTIDLADVDAFITAYLAGCP